MTTPAPSARAFKYLDQITAAFVAVLIISNIASTKIVSLGSLTFDGGTLLFPLAYIFGDILTEVYGYKRSRRVIWTGFLWLAVAAGVFALVGALPSASEWVNQDAYNRILGSTPRIILGSLLAYFAGEFTNSVILARLKVATQGRWLWLRTISSTLIGQGIDTAVFLFIAFWGELPPELMVALFVSNYVFKVGVEVAFTPITYAIVNFLKKRENEDYYDRGTNFNPFSLSVR